MKHYEYEISLFSDNELSEPESDELFKHLAGCTKCRQELRDIMLLKQQSKQIVAQNIADIHSPRRRVNIFYKAGFYIAAAAAVILLLIMATKTPEIIYTEAAVTHVQTPVPEEQVIPGRQETPEAVIKTKNVNLNGDEGKYIKYISSIPGVKLSDDDVITHDYRNDL